MINNNNNNNNKKKEKTNNVIEEEKKSPVIITDFELLNPEKFKAIKSAKIKYVNGYSMLTVVKNDDQIAEYTAKKFSICKRFFKQDFGRGMKWIEQQHVL